MTGGGSGGHITPLFSLARALKERRPDCRLIYVGFKGDRFSLPKSEREQFSRVYKIPAGKFRRYHGESLWSHLFDLKTLALNVRDGLRVMRGFVASVRILRRHRPSVVFSKGGFVSVPVGMAAKVLGIPIVTHDSDASAGLANRIVGRWAALHTTGLPAGYYDYPPNKTIQVGIPLDPRIKPVDETVQTKYKQALGVPAKALVLLVAGGSLGARELNTKMGAVGQKLLAKDPNLHIIHVCGAGNLPDTEAAYRPDEMTSRRLRIIEYSNDFYQLVGAADLIISRAGATAIAEFAMAGKACLLLPAVHLAGGHQLANAQALAEQGAVRVLPAAASTQELKDQIIKLLLSPAARKRLAERLKATAQPAAAGKLAEQILKIVNTKETV